MGPEKYQRLVLNKKRNSGRVLGIVVVVRWIDEIRSAGSCLAVVRRDRSSRTRRTQVEGLLLKVSCERDEMGVGGMVGEVFEVVSDVDFAGVSRYRGRYNVILGMTVVELKMAWRTWQASTHGRQCSIPMTVGRNTERTWSKDAANRMPGREATHRNVSRFACPEP